MKRYQWNDAKLKKKLQLYGWLMILCAGVALVVLKWLSFLPEFVFLGLLGGAGACFVLSWRLRSKDAKMGRKR